MMKMFYWFVITLVSAALAAKKDCPGGSFQCPDSATCCQLLDKTYGCCPLENAVCCEDHIHCCPMNTKCAVDMCVSNDLKHVNISRSLLKKNSTVCPGGKHICPIETTCCKGKDPLSFGCCPMKDAVCCEDGYHCCPADTSCHLATSQCLGKQFNYKMYDSRKHVMFKEDELNMAFQKILKSDKVFNVICPKSSFQCPNGYTCCELPSGEWGCCPFPNAQCCKDHLHCCPEYFKCDEMSQACMKGYNNVSSAEKIPAEKIGPEIICPDKTPCLNSTTCCKIGDKHYGCCPYEDATCCPDFVHCCPKNYMCDVVKQRCVPNFTVKWVR